MSITRVCHITNDGATTACRTCGIAWASDERVRPGCPFGPASDVQLVDGDGISTGKRVLLGLFGAAMLMQLVLGAVIVVAMLRGCAS